MKTMARWCCVFVGGIGAMLTILILSPDQSLPIARAQATSPAQQCGIGAYVVDLGQFDVTNKTFNAQMWLWSTCLTKDLEPLKHMAFENATSAHEVANADPLEKNGVTWAQREVQGTFRHDWDVHNFPFDRHTLDMWVEDGTYDSTGYVYDADTTNSGYDPAVAAELHGWKITRFAVKNDLNTISTTFGDPTRMPGSTSTRARFTISFTIVRDAFASFLKLIAPVLIAFLVSLISYYLYIEGERHLGAQMGLLTGLLLVIVLNSQTASTNLGSNQGMALIDQIHLLALVSILISMVAALMSAVQLQYGRSIAFVQRLNHYVAIYTLLVYIVLNVALIGYAAYMG